MADGSDESYSAPTHRTKHKRDRNDRRERRVVNRYADGIDGTPSPSKEHNSPGLDDSGVANDLANSADRDSGRRDRRDRRKPKEEPEANANDEAPLEGAAAPSEETSPKKTLKKERKSESAHKRQAKRHLREKRRSTGVVIMPGAEGDVSNLDDVFYMSSVDHCAPVLGFCRLKEHPYSRSV